MPDGGVYTAEEQARRAAEADFRSALIAGDSAWFKTHMSQEQREAVVALLLSPWLNGDSAAALAMVRQHGSEESFRQFASALHGAEVMAEANPDTLPQQLGLRRMVGIILPELFDANVWLRDWESSLRSRAELQPYFDLFAGVVAGTGATGVLLIAAVVAALLAVAAPAVGATVAAAVEAVAPVTVTVPGVAAVGITAAEVSVPGLIGSMAGMGTFVGGLRLTEAVVPGAGGLVAATMPIPIAAWEALKSLILLKSPIEFAQSLRAVFAMPWDPASARAGAIDTGEILIGLGLPDNEVSRGIADVIGMMVAAHAAGRFEALASDPAFVAKVRALPVEARDVVMRGVDAYVAAGARGEVINPFRQIFGQSTLERVAGVSPDVAATFPVAFKGPNGEVLVGDTTVHAIQIEKWVAQGRITRAQATEMWAADSPWERGFSAVEGQYAGKFLTLPDVLEIRYGVVSPISPPVEETVPPAGTVQPPEVVSVPVGELEVKDTFQGPAGDRVIVASKDAAGNVILKNGETVTVPSGGTVPGREGSVVVGGALGLKDLPQAVKDAAARFGTMSQAEISALSPDEYTFLKNSADVVDYFKVGSTGAPSVGQASGLPEYLREWVVLQVRGETAPVTVAPPAVVPPPVVAEPGAVLTSPEQIQQWGAIGSVQQGQINGLFKEAQGYGLGREFLDRLEYELEVARVSAGEFRPGAASRDSTAKVIKSMIGWLDQAKWSIGAVGVPPAMPEVPEVGVESAAIAEQVFRSEKPADMSMTEWLRIKGMVQGIITGVFMPALRGRWRELVVRGARWREAGQGLEVDFPYSYTRQYYALVGKFLGDWYLRDRPSLPGVAFEQYVPGKVESAMNAADLALEARHGSKGFIPANQLYPESETAAVQEAKPLLDFFDAASGETVAGAPAAVPVPIPVRVPFGTRPATPFGTQPRAPFETKPVVQLGTGREAPADVAKKIGWLSDSPAVVNEIRGQLSAETVAELELSGVRAVAAGKGDAWAAAVREDVAAAVDNARHTGKPVAWERVLSGDLRVINERIMLPKNTAAVAEPVPESQVPVPPFETRRAPSRISPRMVQVLQSLGWTEAMREGMTPARASEIIRLRLHPGAGTPPPTVPPRVPPVAGGAPEGVPTGPIEIGPAVPVRGTGSVQLPGAAAEAARNARIERIAEIGRTNPKKAAEEAWRLPDDEQSAIGRLIGKGALGRQRADAFARELVLLAAQKHGWSAALQWVKDHPRYGLLAPLGMVSAVAGIFGFVFIQEWTAKEGLVEQLMFPLGMRIRQYQQTPSPELRAIIERDFATLRTTVPMAQAWVRKWAWANPLNKEGWLKTADLWGIQMQQMEAQWQEVLAAESGPKLPSRWVGTVGGVIDGDTLWLKGDVVDADNPSVKIKLETPPQGKNVTVRLVGVNAAETRAWGGGVIGSIVSPEFPGLQWVPAVWAEAAKKWLGRLAGKKVIITIDPAHPKDSPVLGRYLGTVTYNGKDVALEMIDEGLLVIETVEPNAAVKRDVYLQRTLDAQARQKGLWAGVPASGESHAPNLVGVWIQSEPSGGIIYIDGEQTSFKTPKMVDMVVGQHRIDVWKGTVTSGAVVNVAAKGNVPVTVKLPMPEKQKAGKAAAGPVGGVAGPGVSSGGSTIGNPFE